MANSFILSNGTFSYELQYNAASQTEYKILYGARLEVPEPRVALHNPDQAPARAAWAVDLDRLFFFEMHVEPGPFNASWDTALNRIAEIKRLVDGADSQALRYHLVGDVDRVYLRAQLDGATNYTDQIVHWGYVDDGATFYAHGSQRHKAARKVVIGLIFTAYGEGAQIELYNDLGNPAFLFEGSTSGLAAQWSLVSTPTPTLDTTAYLIGGQSQKLAAANTEGIASDNVSLADGEAANAYIWASIVGSASFQIYDATNTTIRDSATLNTTDASAVADKELTDAAGNTWRRVPLSWTNSTGGAVNVQLRVVAAVSSTIYLDAAYLDATLDTTTNPDAWMSGSALENRFDQTTSNPEYINVWDLWGIPGDAPAKVRHELTASYSGGREYLIAAATRDGKYLAANQGVWWESDLFTNEISASGGVWSTGTGTSDNHYHRFTANGGIPANSGSGIRSYSISGATLYGLLAVPRRIFLRARTSNADTLFDVYMDSGLGIWETVAVGVQTVDTWELLEIGTLNARTIYDPAFGLSTPFTLSLFVKAYNMNANATADFDVVWTPWLDQYLLASDAGPVSSGTLYIDGIDSERVVVNPGTKEPTLGGLWNAYPGQVTTRYTATLLDSAYAHAIADSWTVKTVVVPRTRHLLGTL